MYDKDILRRVITRTRKMENFEDKPVDYRLFLITPFGNFLFLDLVP